KLDTHSHKGILISYGRTQGMGFDKERCCGIKGRGIHRREASQPNASGLRGGTQDRPRLDHGLTRTTRKYRAAAATDAASDRAPRVGFGFGATRARDCRPSDLIAGIDRRVSKRVSKGVRNRRVNKRATKGI